MKRPFQVLSYNILANSYINPKWYPNVNPDLLEWEKRKVALLNKIEGFGSDIICLQEVEHDAYTLFELGLSERLRGIIR